MQKLFVKLLLLFLIPLPVFASNQLVSRLIADEDRSLQWRELSKTLEAISEVAEEINPHRQLYMIGSTARQFLDHLYFSKSFSPRDIDLAFIFYREVTPEEVLKFGKQLEERGIGRILLSEFKRRPRSADWLTDNYNAGYGFYLIDPQGRRLDITIFEYLEDFHLNGFLNIDRIALVLKPSLCDFCQNAYQYSYHTLKAKGLILDPESGYLDWLNRDLRIACWQEIESHPLQSTFRLIRSYNRAGIDYLDSQTWWKLHCCLAFDEKRDFSGCGPLLQRCFLDADPALVLKSLSDIGALDFWLPEMAMHLSHLPLSQIPKTFDELIRKLPKDARWKTYYLVYSNDHFKSALLETMYLMSPDKIDKTALKDLLQVIDFESIREVCNRIVFSENLSIDSEERVILMMKAILQQVDGKDREEWILKVCPLFLKEVFIALENRRIGFMTGCFNPVTLLHPALIEIAINENILDEVYLLPVIIDHPDLYLPSWQKRCKMLELQFSDDHRIHVIDKNYESDMKMGLGQGITRLLREKGHHQQYFHMMGTDSFQRYLKYGLPDLYLGENVRVFVQHRAGFVKPPILKRYQGFIHYRDSQMGIPKLFQSESKTLVRKRYKKNLSVDQYLSPQVLHYICQEGLYTADSPLNHSFSLQGADSSDLRIFQRYLPYVQLGDGNSTITMTKKLVLNVDGREVCFSHMPINWKGNSVQVGQFHVTAEFFHLGKNYEVMVILPVNLDGLESLGSWSDVNQKTAILDESDAISLLAQKIQKRVLWHLKLEN